MESMYLLINDEQLFIDYLFTKQDKKYRDFHSSLILSDKLIGIRVPILRMIGKEISKYDFSNMFNFNNFYFEERMILGLAIGYAGYSFEKTILFLNKFLKYIDNWSICDSVSSNLKILKKEQEEGMEYIKCNINSNDEFTERLCYVLLLNHFINDNYIDDIMDLLYKFKSKNKYYVDMAVSWLISFIYIKYPDMIIKLFSDNILQKNIQNKAISKICDSYRVKSEEKILLKGFRVK